MEKINWETDILLIKTARHIQNPNCDGEWCTSATGEVRRLPTGGDSAVILCKDCYNHEMEWRKGRNEELEESAKFDLPKWEDLKAYKGASVKKAEEKYIPKGIKKRLEYLRNEIENERISEGEIVELQSLAEYIEPGDVLLLQWAGVPEFPEDKEASVKKAEEKYIPKGIKKRLEYLRNEIENERISEGEIVELQSLAEYIEPGDVLLLQWAGVPEFPEDKEASLKKADAVNEVGDGKLPNKYWITTGSDFLMNTEGTNEMNYASENGIDTGNKGQIIEPGFNTFAEALNKTNEIIESEVSAEPEKDKVNCVMIEDRLSGIIWQGCFYAYPSKSGMLKSWKYEWTVNDDTKYTKEKMQEMGEEFK